MDKKLTPLEALEKIDHTVCLAFNENNKALFNKDYIEHIDCKDIYEFGECCEIIETTLKKIESPLTKEYLAYENKNLREAVDKLIEKQRAFDIIKNNSYLSNLILAWASGYDDVNNTNLYGALEVLFYD